MLQKIRILTGDNRASGIIFLQYLEYPRKTIYKGPSKQEVRNNRSE